MNVIHHFEGYKTRFHMRPKFSKKLSCNLIENSRLRGCAITASHIFLRDLIVTVKVQMYEVFA